LSYSEAVVVVVVVFVVVNNYYCLKKITLDACGASRFGLVETAREEPLIGIIIISRVTTLTLLAATKPAVF
jgi:hypothetical protein